MLGTDVESDPEHCHLHLASKVQTVAWAQSEPPRGSGWVRRRHLRNINKIKRVYDVPTRYREVVLTVSKPGSDQERDLLER